MQQLGLGPVPAAVAHTRPARRQGGHVSRAAAQVDPRAEKELGARDPFEGELKSNFGSKVLGFADTAHVVRGPGGLEELVGLATKQYTPEAAAAVLSEVDTNKLRTQVAGWQMRALPSGAQSLQQEWRAKDSGAAGALRDQLAGFAAREERPCEVSIQADTAVTACISSNGGLTFNDFILAAKLNTLDLKAHLAPSRARFWA